MVRIYVDTRAKFEQLIGDVHHADLLTFDTETNGLDLWGGHSLVGLSVYAGGNSYYLPIAHGEGVFTPPNKNKANIKHTAATNAAMDIHRVLNPYYNIPSDWIDELKTVWSTPSTHLAHNAQFDLTVLAHAGFPKPKRCLDTMLGAYTLFTDWRRAWFTMPDTGGIEAGNMRLKWLARLFRLVTLENGAIGDESALYTGLETLRDLLTVHVDPSAKEDQTSLFDVDKIPGAIIPLEAKKHLWALPGEVVAEYAMMDVELTYTLHTKFLILLEKWDNVPLYNHLCDVNYYVAWRMYMTGYTLDTDGAQAMQEQAAARLNELIAEACTLTGLRDFNPNSASQLKDYLHSIGLKVASTNKKTLAPHKADVPLLPLIAELRSVGKLSSTYLKNWLDRSDVQNDGKIHPSFKVWGTSTGRWSGDLQQVPQQVNNWLAPKKLLKAVDPTRFFFEVDYSTLELRVGAWVAETLLGKGHDLTMTNLILEGTDMHAYTRDKVGIPGILLKGDVTVDNAARWLQNARVILDNPTNTDILEAFMAKARSVAKTTNFAIMYGSGAKGLSEGLEIPYPLADQILKGWRRTYPAIPNAMRKLTAIAKTTRPAPDGTGAFNYITYPLGDWGLIKKFDYYKQEYRNKVMGDAFASMVQGTASLIVSASALEICQKYPDEMMLMHSAIHDSLEPSIPAQHLHILKDIGSIMCNWDVHPGLTVNFEYVPPGGAWGEKQEIEDLDAFIAKYQR
jgi:DNA polymerase I-like protein with 3'-5' exonuclease and polymerase domains